MDFGSFVSSQNRLPASKGVASFELSELPILSRKKKPSLKNKHNERLKHGNNGVEFMLHATTTNVLNNPFFWYMKLSFSSTAAVSFLLPLFAAIHRHLHQLCYSSMSHHVWSLYTFLVFRCILRQEGYAVLPV
jgi:hypothetical protein